MDSQVELTAITPRTGSSSVDEQRREEEQAQVDRTFSLKPADGGKDAWLFLLGGFFMEAIVWGFPFAFGIFQEYYTHHEPFSADAGGVAIIGTTASGLMYFLSLVVMPLYHRYPWLRQWSGYVGLPLMATAVILASFANSVWQLILTQGVLYGIGGALLYFPVILYLDEWFIRRKGLAFGVVWAGTGAAGMTLPLVLSALLERYGFRTTLRVWACAMVVILAPLMYFVKPRLPQAASRQFRPADLRFLMSPLLWTLQICNVVESLGFFLPSIYLPTIAQRFGSSSVGASGTLVALNLSAVFGGLVVGVLVDRMSALSVMVIVSTIAASATFLIWGFAQSFPLLIFFAALYGLSAGGYSTTWPGMIRELQNQHEGADTGIILGILGTGRGIGAIASGPLSAALVGNNPAFENAVYGYGSEYGRLIIFTGVTAAAGGLGWFARSLRLI